MMDANSAATRPYHAYRPRKAGKLRMTAVIAAFAILAAAVAVALYIAVQAWSAAGALTVQNRQLRGQVTSVREQMRSLKSGERNDYATLGHLLAPILPYTTTVCSQYLTDPNGQPATFYFACSSQKPSPPPPAG